MSPLKTPWLEGKTIGQVLRLTALLLGKRGALVFPRCKFKANCARFDHPVDEAAQGLLSLGLNKGDHLVIWSRSVCPSNRGRSVSSTPAPLGIPWPALLNSLGLEPCPEDDPELW